MLNFQEKLKIFNLYLEENKSYVDGFNEVIFIYSKNYKFSFLKKMQSKEDIEKWINMLKHRIVMHEDDDSVDNIIDDYIGYTLSDSYINNFC